ncbi:MAG: SCO family protein [Verrucomicrobiota bacterium]|nr:SCO family protein [Verrucomicrobiota bacterium]
MSAAAPPLPKTRASHAIFYVAFFLVAAAAASVLYLQFRLQHPPLLRFRQLPDFSLVQSDGNPIRLADLRGKIWVADFIYTTCPGPCPLVSGHLSELQPQLLRDQRIEIVSFSVDPQNDTAEVLRGYAQKYHADTTRWHFVTGNPAQMHSLIQDGFMLAATEGSPGDEAVVHSTKLALVDGHGVVRGYYDALAKDQHQLLEDAAALLREK